MYDELALSLISDKQVLVEIFELISEQSAHIFAPLINFGPNISNCHQFINVWLFQNTHEDVHNWCACDFLRTVKELTAELDDQTMFLFDEEMISLLTEMSMICLKQTT